MEVKWGEQIVKVLRAFPKGSCLVVVDVIGDSSKQKDYQSRLMNHVFIDNSSPEARLYFLEG